MTVTNLISAGGRFEFADADPQRRTVTGLVVEYGTVAASGGRRWRFTPGSLHWSSPSRVKLNLNHQREQLVGVATALWESPRGLHGTFRIARTRDGDETLRMAADGILDGFSIEVDFDSPGDGFDRDPSDPSVSLVHRGTLRGVAMTGTPAYDNARLESVMASRDGGIRLDVLLDGQLGDQVRQFSSTSGESMSTIVRDALRRRVGAAYTTPRPVYAMSGSPGQPSMVRDRWIDKHPNDGDPVAARDRLNAHQQWQEQFRATFAADTTTAAAVVPPGYEPLVAAIDTDRPFYRLAGKGTLRDGTPFPVPSNITDTSIESAVSDHTQGVPPVEGSFATSTVTVSPVGLSGRFRVTRELFDSSNPAIDALALAMMREDWNRQTEQKMFTAVNTAQSGTITAGRVPSGAQARTSTATALPADLRKTIATFPDVRKAMPRGVVASTRSTVAEPLADGLDESTGTDSTVWRVMGLPVLLSPWITGTAADDGDVFVIGSDLWSWSSPLLEFSYFEREGPEFVQLAVYGYFATAVIKPAGIASIRHT